ncbi:MAG: HlyD family efflux transporter periplasmic adaptor subunit [Vicinamibacteria bacterium]
MNRPRLLGSVVLLATIAAVAYSSLRPKSLTLTGIVTTNDVVVSPQVAGLVAELHVTEGDLVKKGELIATISPDELKADTAYFAQNAQGLTSQVRESEAALRLEQSLLSHQTTQAESNLAAIEAQVLAGKADVEAAAATYKRTQSLARQQIASAQDMDQARAAVEAAQARLDALRKQVEAQREAVALARANTEQVTVKRSQVQATQHLEAAAAAQSTKANVRLGYAELRAPIDGQVDVRAVRAGEYVSAGQPVVTLINPDDLWVRADIEESYIEGIRIGDTLTVRFPSGEEKPGTVFYRGVDAAYATQRDVSRTKRDIKTFEVRLRVDNRDRRMALGMTAYVSLPVR